MTGRRLGPALAAVIVAAAALVSNTPVGGVAGFGDVAHDAFYTEAVQWMVDNDITTGTAPTCFSPSDPVTRGQAATFMWRTEGRPSAPAHPFLDIVAPWQQQPVSWMAAEEITTGTTTMTYSPEDILTRGQVAALLWRLAGEPAAPPHSFDDVGAPWQQGPVSWMASATPVITTGTSPTTLSPDDPVTRGQLATFFHRFKGEPPTGIDMAHPDTPICRSQVPGPPADTQSAASAAALLANLEPLIAEPDPTRPRYDRDAFFERADLDGDCINTATKSSRKRRSASP